MMQAFSTEGLRSEAIAATIRSVLLCRDPQDPLVRFLPYMPGTRKVVGQAKKRCNTEDEVCYCNADNVLRSWLYIKRLKSSLIFGASRACATPRRDGNGDSHNAPAKRGA